MSDFNCVLPQNIGIIMDGNGRWAKKRGLPRYAGHAQGARVFRKIIRYLNKIGVRYVTVYAFSTENWVRPKKEIDEIIKLLDNYLDDAEKYIKENVKTRFIGDRSAFGEKLVAKMERLEKLSEDFTGLTLNIAVNYGSRNEIVNAAKQIAAKASAGEISPDDIDDDMLSDHMYTSEQPDVDLILRPSGEFRLSNFLMWQAAYAEFIFMDVLWPDFTEKDMDKALNEYASRNRRFGGV